MSSVVHPTKDVKLPSGDIRAPTLYDVSGSAHWYNAADHGIVISRDTTTNIAEISIEKSRYREGGVPGSASLRAAGMGASSRPLKRDGMGRPVKIIVETLSHIDVNHLHRLGAFTEVTLWFPVMRLRTNRWVVKYFHARSPADRPPQRIPIQWTHCTFGAARPWFMCLFCGRRVGKLYVPMASLVVGRAADRLQSQRSGPKRRLYMKAKRIRCRLGDYDGRPGIDPFPPPRRFRMHRKTMRASKGKVKCSSANCVGRVYVPREHRNRPY